MNGIKLLHNLVSTELHHISFPPNFHWSWCKMHDLNRDPEPLTFDGEALFYEWLQILLLENNSLVGTQKIWCFPDKTAKKHSMQCNAAIVFSSACHIKLLNRLWCFLSASQRSPIQRANHHFVSLETKKNKKIWSLSLPCCSWICSVTTRRDVLVKKKIYLKGIWRLCCFFFFPPSTRGGDVLRVTQGDSRRLWQWTMDSQLHNIHYVVGWNVSELDARSPKSDVLWSAAPLLAAPPHVFSAGTRKNILVEKKLISTKKKKNIQNFVRTIIHLANGQYLPIVCCFLRSSEPTFFLFPLPNMSESPGQRYLLNRRLFSGADTWPLTFLINSLILLLSRWIAVVKFMH